MNFEHIEVTSTRFGVFPHRHFPFGQSFEGQLPPQVSANTRETKNPSANTPSMFFRSAIVPEKNLTVVYWFTKLN